MPGNSFHQPSTRTFLAADPPRGATVGHHLLFARHPESFHRLDHHLLQFLGELKQQLALAVAWPVSAASRRDCGIGWVFWCERDSAWVFRCALADVAVVFENVEAEPAGIPRAPFSRIRRRSDTLIDSIAHILQLLS